MIHILIPNKDKPGISKVLSNFVALDNIFEFKSINIVDLGSGYFNKLINTDFGKPIKFIYYHQQYFNKSKAINLGINFLRELPEEYVLICDADIIFDKITLRMFIDSQSCILDKVVESENESNIRKAYGIIKVKIGSLIEVNGYDSNFKGWGLEDEDIIERLSYSNDLKRMGKCIHLSHNDNERIQNYEESSIEFMRESNYHYFINKNGNDKSGTLKQDTKNLSFKSSYNHFNDLLIYE
jgi:predicted glycosyltransferase involved in capsule biosynthesis